MNHTNNIYFTWMNGEADTELFVKYDHGDYGSDGCVISDFEASYKGRKLTRMTNDFAATIHDTLHEQHERAVNLNE